MSDVPKLEVVEDHPSWRKVELTMPEVFHPIQRMIQEKYVEWMKGQPWDNLPNVLLLSPDMKDGLNKEVSTSLFVSGVKAKGEFYWNMLILTVLDQGEPFLAVGRI